MAYSDILLKIANFKQTDFYLSLTEHLSLPFGIQNATRQYPENLIQNFVTIKSSFDNLNDAIYQSASNISQEMRNHFGTNRLFTDIENQLNQATRKTINALSEFQEASSLGNLNPIDAQEFQVVAAGILNEVKQQSDSIQRYRMAMVQGNQIDPSVTLDFDAVQQQLSASMLKLQEIKDRAKGHIETAKLVRERLQDGAEAVPSLLKSALKDFRGAYTAIFRGNSKEALKMLSSLNQKIAASTTLMRGDDKVSPMRRALLGSLAGLAGVMNMFVQGIGFLVKPASLFFGSGIVGLAKLLFNILSSAREFNRTLLERRGVRQLNYDLTFELGESTLKEELNAKNIEFGEALTNTEYEFLKTTNNIYNMTKEQFVELDALTSQIHLKKVISEADETISSTEAQFKLANEVITFSTALGVEQSSVAQSLESMVNEQQYSFETAGLALAYLADVAARGNVSTVKMFGMYQNLQRSSVSLGTNVSFVLDLLGLLQDTKAGNEEAKLDIFKKAETFLNEGLTFGESVSSLIKPTEITSIVDAYKKSQGITSETTERAIRLRQLGEAVKNLNSTNGAVSEFARQQLEYLMKQEPELLMSFAFAKIDRIFKTKLKSKSIGELSSKQLMTFLAQNRVEIRAIFGNSTDFVENFIRILAGLKDRSKSQIKNAAEFTQKLHTPIVNATIQAKVRKEDLITKTKQSRDHTNNMFNGLRNWVDALVTRIVPFIEGFADFVSTIGLFFTGNGFSAAWGAIKNTVLGATKSFLGDDDSWYMATTMQSFSSNYSEYIRFNVEAKNLADKYAKSRQSSDLNDLKDKLKKIKMLEEILLYKIEHTDEAAQGPADADQKARLHDLVIRRRVSLKPGKIIWNNELEEDLRDFIAPVSSLDNTPNVVINPQAAPMFEGYKGKLGLIPEDKSSFMQAVSEVVSGGRSIGNVKKALDAIDASVPKTGQPGFWEKDKPFTGSLFFAVRYDLGAQGLRPKAAIDSDILRSVTDIAASKLGDPTERNSIIGAFLKAAAVKGVSSVPRADDSAEAYTDKVNNIIGKMEEIFRQSGVSAPLRWKDIVIKALEKSKPSSSQLTAPAPASGVDTPQQPEAPPENSKTSGLLTENLTREPTKFQFQGPQQLPEFYTGDGAFSMMLSDKFTKENKTYFFAEVDVHLAKEIQYFNQSQSKYETVGNNEQAKSAAKLIVVNYLKRMVERT